jgi:hypothetical protein
MNPIAVFYHCVFCTGQPPKEFPNAYPIIQYQMQELEESGLIEHTAHFLVGVNGNCESLYTAMACMPKKAKYKLHGLKSRAENLTIIEIEKFVKDHPDWNVLYFHSKGATHTDVAYLKQVEGWRNCMMRHCVTNWTQCVQDLQSHDSVGCHYMVGMGTDKSQNIWAGNFWWATSNFLRTVPSMFERERIKESGIAALESRYESEVWIGNGKVLPNVKDYHREFGGTPCY